MSSPRTTGFVLLLSASTSPGVAAAVATERFEVPGGIVGWQRLRWLAV